MARPLRIEYEGAVYHVTSRGKAGEPIFRDDEDRENILATIKKVIARYNYLCHGYRLMDNLAWNTAKSAHGPWRLSHSPAQLTGRGV